MADDYVRLSRDDVRENYSSKFKQRYGKNRGMFAILKKVFTYAKDYRFLLYAALFLDVIYTVALVYLPVYIGKSINCIVSVGNVNFDALFTNTVVIFIIGEGNGTPLQYSCLENPMNGGAWSAAVHGVARSRHD